MHARGNHEYKANEGPLQMMKGAIVIPNSNSNLAAPTIEPLDGMPISQPHFMKATARIEGCRFSWLILTMVSVIGWDSPAWGQGGLSTADYFPVQFGAEWLYEGIMGPFTTDYQVEIDQTEFIDGRISSGFYSYLPNADDEEIFDDRGREFFSFGSAGLYLDKTFVDPDVGNNYTIHWNGLNIIGSTLEVGAVKDLAGNVRMTLSILEWNGTGSGTATVQAQETVTVPAGTFSTYRVRILYSHSLTIDEPFPDAPDTINGTDDTTLWLAEGVGIVKQEKTRTSDAFGTQSGTFNLKSYQVAMPPSITSQPQGVTTGPCADVIFQAAADGALPLSYQWRKNNVPITGAQSSSLTLAGVTPADAGDYTVVVNNAFDSVTSQIAVLTITNPPLPQILAESLQRLPDGRLRFLFEGSVAYSAVDVMGTTDLISWARLASFTNGVGSVEFVDPNTNLTQRFYQLYRRCTN